MTLMPNSGLTRLPININRQPLILNPSFQLLRSTNQVMLRMNRQSLIDTVVPLSIQFLTIEPPIIPVTTDFMGIESNRDRIKQAKSRIKRTPRRYNRPVKQKHIKHSKIRYAKRGNIHQPR